ncbi:uncharacterized protein (DUF1499 family) [Scopulibacillus darangshiensis]|uniref:Uncharacterized protein (DUF1499 family) n=2 Tax=Scopulibacillus darangshiensis TaxID=442528 RepID=A0A4R2NI58_9BACL|nr:uncharacterized protein (DUF1499 family) [Scopulibacillus darangshiensis]
MDKDKKGIALGLQDGQLAPCPKTPNCVSTEHHDLNRKMLPMSYQNMSIDEAKKILLEVIHSMPRVEIKEQSDDYIHVVYRTLVFEFFHDAEFHFDSADKHIHYRSATRVGFADFGSNKRWLQSIYARFIQRTYHITKEN